MREKRPFSRFVQQMGVSSSLARVRAPFWTVASFRGPSQQ